MIFRKIRSVVRSFIFKFKTHNFGKKIRVGCSVKTYNNNIKVGNNTYIGDGTIFWGDGLIEIGDNSDIGFYSIIFSSEEGGVFIGRDTSIAAQCYIIDMDHQFMRDSLIKDQKDSVGKIVIGNDVWIAANVTVLKGSTIKDGSVVGAKSLVKMTLPEYSVAMGVPARVVKYR